MYPQSLIQKTITFPKSIIQEDVQRQKIEDTILDMKKYYNMAFLSKKAHVKKGTSYMDKISHYCFNEKGELCFTDACSNFYLPSIKYNLIKNKPTVINELEEQGASDNVIKNIPDIAHIMTTCSIDRGFCPEKQEIENIKIYSYKSSMYKNIRKLIRNGVI